MDLSTRRASMNIKYLIFRLQILFGKKVPRGDMDPRILAIKEPGKRAEVYL
jgi:hypothetical protein